MVFSSFTVFPTSPLIYFMNKNDTWIAKASDMPSFSFWLFVEHEDSKFVLEWELLRNAYSKYYSYSGTYSMGARIMDISSAVRRFCRLYENDLPNICSRLKMNYLYMDNNALNILIDENEIEVRGLLKREEKQKKLQEIQEVRNNFLA